MAYSKKYSGIAMPRTWQCPGLPAVSFSMELAQLRRQQRR
jgi:hypothetical protein